MDPPMDRVAHLHWQAFDKTVRTSPESDRREGASAIASSRHRCLAQQQRPAAPARRVGKTLYWSIPAKSATRPERRRRTLSRDCPTDSLALPKSIESDSPAAT